MSFDPEQITFFAQTDARGQSVPFGIKAKDRTRHVYVIGKTGMGKSTLLENMAIQDIKNGNGLAFIDPHGQTAETLLDYIPDERKDDVLYFAPFDMDYPVSFNVMEDVGPDKRHLVVSGLMSVFEKIWVDAWSARMAYILQNTLMALLEYPDSTLLGVNRMLSDKNYRKKVVDNIKDPSVRSFWVDEFAKYNERYMQEAGDAIKNKIGQFTANPLIRNIVGQPKSSFDIRKIMDEKKILIMNLSKGLVGESNANLLGSMLTTRIYLAAMSRADMGQEALQAAPNFYFYVDEFQSFANATFANILSEARKYKLNLTIAHQYIEQMEEEVRNAVFGNVGTIISFRVGPFDAEVLETIFTPKFLAPDIVNLGFAQVYLTLMIDGIGSQPFSATTLPPITPAQISYKNVIIHHSREQFAHPRSEVERMIYQWHGMQDPQGAETKREQDSAPVRAEVSPAPVPRADVQEKEKRTDRSGENSAGEKPAREQQNSGGSSRKDNGSKDKPKRPREQGNSQGPHKTERRSGENSKPGRSLDDLREVLRTISAKESDTSRQDSRQRSKATDHAAELGQKAAEPAAGLSLRDALASVLEQAPGAKHVPEQKPPKPPEETQKEPPVPHGEAAAYAEKKNIDDPLSPKRLERMMHVNANEKSPLL